MILVRVGVCVVLIWDFGVLVNWVVWCCLGVGGMVLDVVEVGV